MTELTWQLIETAPKDGRFFVIARFVDGKCDEYEVGRYKPYNWRSYVEREDGLFEAVDKEISEWSGFNNFHRATHWMNLLPAPEAKT